MTTASTHAPICAICGVAKPRADLVPAALVRPSIAKEIRKSQPQWTVDSFICEVDLNQFRERYVQSLLETERGELTALEQEVITSIRQQEILARNLPIQFEKDLATGERMADLIAKFGGSWTFIFFFGLFLFVWVAVNSIVLLWQPFDPYPYILLNLLLSCLAAIQAPVILMSQNRQEAKDRLRAEHDYQVNLKAELEIRHLHEKIDHLLLHQWERLVEIQQIQIELMNELTARRNQPDTNL